MIDSKQLGQAVCAYVGRHFEGAVLIDEKCLPIGEGRAYFFKAGEDEYELRIMDELADTVQDGTEMEAFLTDFDAANVMRALTDFPITVSLNGCVFEDF